MTSQFVEMTLSSYLFDFVFYLLSSLMTGPNFMSISSLVLELGQFSFIRDWPEIRKSETPPFEFCPISGNWGELEIANLTRMSQSTDDLPILNILPFCHKTGKAKEAYTGYINLFHNNELFIRLIIWRYLPSATFSSASDNKVLKENALSNDTLVKYDQQIIKYLTIVQIHTMTWWIHLMATSKFHILPLICHSESFLEVCS